MKKYLNQVEIEQVAKIHYNSIKDGFLTSLGPSFLTFLYEAINESQHSFILVKYKDGKIVGFVSGGLGLQKIYRIMLSQPLRLLQVIGPKLLNPSTLLQVLRIIARSKFSASSDFSSISAELYSLAVYEQHRREGIAAELYDNLCDQFEKMKVQKFIIVVGGNLKKAQKFYKASGAKISGILNQGTNKSSLVFVHNI